MPEFMFPFDFFAVSTPVLKFGAHLFTLQAEACAQIYVSIRLLDIVSTSLRTLLLYSDLAKAYLH